MKNFISKKIRLAFLVLISLYSTTTNAGHILGTHITYTYVSANTYNVKVAFYRDCQGLPAGQQATLCYSSVSGSLSGTLPLTMLTPTFFLPDFPYFPPMLSSCLGGNGLGIERIIYEGTLILPAAMPDWVLSYSTFPQNVGINQNFMYVSTKIDNVNYPVNSSSKYVTDPTFAYCINQPAWDNFASTDTDGDSLSYHRIPILDNTTVCPPAPFQNPLQPFNPLQSSTPIIMDSTNGSLTFTPTTAGQAMVSARVDEFRNGILINSSTVEHVMYLVTGCVISGINDNKSSVLSIHPNPVNDVLVVDLSGTGAPVYIEATDISGKIFSLDFTSNSSGNYFLDVKMLPSGIYTIRVTSENATSLNRFVKL